VPATTPRSRPSQTPATARPETAPADAAAALDDLTYEQAREELVGVVARLEAGGETLEGSLALWERGEALAARCQQWLDGARARLDAARGAANPDRVAEPAPAEPDDQDQDDE
jgi:exodeoxyribonuclease VII small subunit